MENNWYKEARIIDVGDKTPTYLYCPSCAKIAVNRGGVMEWSDYNGLKGLEREAVDSARSGAHEDGSARFDQQLCEECSNRTKKMHAGMHGRTEETEDVFVGAESFNLSMHKTAETTNRKIEAALRSAQMLWESGKIDDAIRTLKPFDPDISEASVRMAINHIIKVKTSPSEILVEAGITSRLANLLAMFLVGVGTAFGTPGDSSQATKGHQNTMGLGGMQTEQPDGRAMPGGQFSTAPTNQIQSADMQKINEMLSREKMSVQRLAEIGQRINQIVSEQAPLQQKGVADNIEAIKGDLIKSLQEKIELYRSTAKMWEDSGKRNLSQTYNGGASRLEGINQRIPTVKTTEDLEAIRGEINEVVSIL